VVPKDLEERNAFILRPEDAAFMFPRHETTINIFAAMEIYNLTLNSECFWLNGAIAD
jgi:hypothetical protein